MWRWRRCRRRIEMGRQRGSVVVSDILRGLALPLIVVRKDQTGRHAYRGAGSDRYARQPMQSDREEEARTQKKISAIFSLERLEWPAFPAPAKIAVDVFGSGKLLFSKAFSLLAFLLYAIKSLVNSSTKRPRHLAAGPFLRRCIEYAPSIAQRANFRNLPV